MRVVLIVVVWILGAIGLVGLFVIPLYAVRRAWIEQERHMGVGKRRVFRRNGIAVFGAIVGVAVAVDAVYAPSGAEASLCSH
jgi:hypothetical protein